MKRTSTLERRALALLEAALERPSGARDAFVDRETASDPQLRARMRQLLSASADDDLLKTGGAPLDEAPTPAPERVGAYRITETLGQGGMGAVYKARREAGDFEHVAAIKLIRPGALSSALVERFKHERQILAELIHPNIARLYDGGATASGEPFIVMEYVDGLPIDRWAGEQRLGVAGRLKLFLAACDAVRFAHQNLIVHRDITPPNVLVTAEGVVKLIDFGISKPADLEEAAGTALGPGAAGTLTPGFAAPERLTGAGATTLSDIYSLGRLLEVLLEGQPADADLAAIVAEATAADPQARYPSVDALMEDVERFLAGRPVAARRGDAGYVFGKFVRRHRWPVGLSAAGVVLVLGALVFATASFVRAEQARAAEAERFGQVRSLAGYLLFEFNEELAGTPGNTAARAALAAKAQTYLNVLARSRQDDPKLRQETAQGLIRLARIQGVPPDPNLGERKAAQANLALAEQMLIRLSAADPAGVATDLARARIYQGLITALHDTDIAAGKASLKLADANLASVPATERSGAWHETLAMLRRAQAEVAYLDMDDPGVARIAQTMEAEWRAWPAALREGRAGADHLAWAEFYRATSQSAVTSGDFGLPAMVRAKSVLTDLDRRWPNDPTTLYRLTYLDFMLFASAAQAGQNAVSSAAIGGAQTRIKQLMALEENDRSLTTLSVNIGQAYAQDLSNRDLHAQAVEAQRAVLSIVEGRLTPERRAITLADMGYSQLMLGLIGRKAGDRALACDSWTKARALFAEVEARQPLTGFHAGFQPGLKANLALCESGAPVAAFKPLQ